MADRVKNRLVVGKPIWHIGDGETPVLGFLMAEVNSDSNPMLLVGFIDEGIVGIVRPTDCWVAEIHEVKTNLRGIICTNPEWGAGMIVDQSVENSGCLRVRIGLPNGGFITTSLSQVVLCCFGQRP